MGATNMLLQSLSLLLLLTGEGLAQRAGRPLAGKIPQKPLTPPQHTASWIGCQGPDWHHVTLPNGGYTCEKRDKGCSGRYLTTNGKKHFECCPTNTYYRFNKKFGQGDCCPPRNGYMVHPASKKGSCCPLHSHYFYNLAVSRGACCGQGRVFAVDIKTKTGACCPPGKAFNGIDCSGVAASNVQCAAYQVFDEGTRRCKDVCKHTEYWCAKDKKCKTCAEGTRYDMGKKMCQSICKPNVEFWCTKAKKCMPKKPCSDGQKCCNICTIDQKWCIHSQKCIDKCPKGQTSVMGKCIQTPVSSAAVCNAAAAKRVPIKCPGPACYLPKEEEIQMVFGPKGSWFFNIRTVVGARFWHGLPPALEALVSKDNASGWVNDLSISPDGEWMIIKSDGDSHWWKCSNIKKYPVLEKWMKETKFRLQTLRVTLGVNGAFFAYHEHGYRWVGLNEPENEHLQSMLNNRHNFLPHHLSIGLTDNYVITSKLGNHFRKTLPLYPTLDCILRQTPQHNVAYVALNPYTPDEYFVAYSDMTASWKVSGPLAAQIAKFNGVLASAKAKVKPYTIGSPRMRVALNKPKHGKIRMARVVRGPVDAQHDDHEWEQQHFEMEHHDDVHLDHDEHSADHHAPGDVHQESHHEFDDDLGHHEFSDSVHHEEHIDLDGLHAEVHHVESHHESHDFHEDASGDGAHLPPGATHTEESDPMYAHSPVPLGHPAVETHGPDPHTPVDQIPHLHLSEDSEHVTDHNDYLHEHLDHHIENPEAHPDDHKWQDESAYHHLEHSHDEAAHDLHEAHSHLETSHEADHHVDETAHHEAAGGHEDHHMEDMHEHMDDMYAHMEMHEEHEQL